MRFFIAPLLLFSALAHAQAPSPWQGEWGGDGPLGGRLTIDACTGQSCTFRLTHGGCSVSNGASFLVSSPTEATAALPGEDAAHSCTLQLHREQSAITIKQSGNGCGYYCISNATGFDTRVLRRSSVAYTGAHSEECMNTAGPARMATCTDASLASLEEQWESLYNDFPLAPVPTDSSVYQHATKLDAQIVKDCNSAADPAQCLRARFTTEVALMTAHKDAYIDGTTERGEPAQGGRIARSIAGRYRHTFDNGDVQGHHYRTTDKLTLSPVGRASISFDADLNFYNGHTCSISGGALFRKDGSFVFDDDPTSTVKGDPVCRLAIIPTAKGIEFKDLTGGCKLVYCGARGSFNGEGFSFTDRVPAHVSASAKPAQK